MENKKLAELANRIICICAREKPEMAAVISSYLNSTGYYTIIFEFPQSIKEENGSLEDEDLLRPKATKEFGFHLINFFHRLTCEAVIIAGLSAAEKNVLPPFINLITIDQMEDIDFYLSSFFEPREKLSCRREQMFEGLIIALKQNKILQLDDQVDDIFLEPTQKRDGIIIVENEQDISTIVAINYAQAVEAEIVLVEALENFEEYEINQEIVDWRGGNLGSYAAVSKRIDERIKKLNLEQYAYATFFTRGLPYSLRLSNTIPCTYVSLTAYPDFFIAFNFMMELVPAYDSAVIFSPGMFDDDECATLSNKLNDLKIYVRELNGSHATILNIDFHLRAFPYDLFHICSHGGEIKGDRMIQQFTDKKGETHEIEFDRVWVYSESTQRGERKIQKKDVFQKLDGASYTEAVMTVPNYIIKDMAESLSLKNIERTENCRKTLLYNIVATNSCSIATFDGIYQGFFERLPSVSPVIFNNTCWSTGEIAKSFLENGARGYFGTLWNIPNETAVSFAKCFYEHAYNGTLMDAFQQAEIKSGMDYDSRIYMYYGLHFTKLKLSKSTQEARFKVFAELSRFVNVLADSAKSRTDEISQRMENDLHAWVVNEIFSHFWKEYIDMLQVHVNKKQRNG